MIGPWDVVLDQAPHLVEPKRTSKEPHPPRIFNRRRTRCCKLFHQQPLSIIYQHLMSGRKIDPEESLVHLARYVAQGATRDAVALIRRDLPQIGRVRPDLNEPIRVALAAATSPSFARAVNMSTPAAPSDRDSRLELVKEELLITMPGELRWPSSIASELEGVVLERARADELKTLGVAPTRSLLLVGPPGVGKTQAARWLAQQLNRPLLTLDLATVMSSLLGRTGNNIRAVLDYARAQDSVLLLDEFDSVAKRRDDSTDIGELKRLVTVLLQAIDEWPANGVLVAATNHPELLDPAVWRRFERVINFPAPTIAEIRELAGRLAGNEVDVETINLVAAALQGGGFADVVKEINVAKRDSIVRGQTIQESLEGRLQQTITNQPRSKRLSVAKKMAAQGASQRAIQSMTGIARDTLRVRGIGISKKT